MRHVPKKNKLSFKFLVYSVLETAVGYLTTLHFNSQQETHPTLVWAITLRWWDRSCLHPTQGQHLYLSSQHLVGTNFTPWYGGVSQWFRETCSASPPAAVLVVMAVRIEPRLPTYKPCLLTTRLLWLNRWNVQSFGHCWWHMGCRIQQRWHRP